jgi:hypothetical protein
MDGTASSPAQAAGMRSKWRCHGASPSLWRVGKSLMSNGMPASP